MGSRGVQKIFDDPTTYNRFRFHVFYFKNGFTIMLKPTNHCYHPLSHSKTGFGCGKVTDNPYMYPFKERVRGVQIILPLKAMHKEENE